MKRNILALLLALLLLFVAMPLSAFAKIAGVEVLSGAQVRLDGTGETSLRFTGRVEKSTLDTLAKEHAGAEILCGIAVCKKEPFDLFGITYSASVAIAGNSVTAKITETPVADLTPDGDDAFLFFGESDPLGAEEINEKYVGLGYIRVIGDPDIYVDAPFRQADHIRSAYEVSHTALAGDDLAAPYNERLTSYLDRVVIISGKGTSLSFPEDTTYKTPYTIDGSSKETAIVLTGDKINKTDKVCLYLNGVRYLYGSGAGKAGYNYKAGQVKITPALLPQQTASSRVSLAYTKNFSATDFFLFADMASVNFRSFISLTGCAAADLTWFSSNDKVISVDNSDSRRGVFHAAGEAGVAYLMAKAKDGAKSNVLVVNVLPSRGYSDTQLLNLTLGSPAHNTEGLLLYDTSTTLVFKSYGDAHICLWKDDARGAASFTVDDSITGDFDAWNTMSATYGIPVTFFVQGKYATQSSHTNAWKKQIAAGQAVQSHSYNHLSKEPLEARVADAAPAASTEAWLDFYTTLVPISTATGVPVEVCAYSNGVDESLAIAGLFVAARGTYGTPNQALTVNYLNTNSVSLSTDFGTDATKRQNFINAVRTVYDPKVQYFNSFYRGWTSFHCHGVSGGATALSNFFGSEYVSGARDSGLLYIDTFANVAKYGQERDTATLTKISANANEMVFSLTDKMADTIYTQPLTVRVRVDETWTGATANQDGTVRTAKIDVQEGVTYVLFDMVPDAGNLTLTRKA